MKTNQNLTTIAILMATLLLATPSFAESLTITVNSTNSTLSEAPGNPGKKKRKKCRRCPYARPDRIFDTGQWDLFAGFGAVPTFLMDGAKILLPPVSAGLEYRFNEKFSLGILAGHSISRSQPRLISDGVEASWKNSFYHIALRPAVHITSIENWDFYGGLSAGIQVCNVSGKASSPDVDLAEMESHLGIGGTKTNGTYSGFAGVRYVVSPKWTVGAEAGFSVSILTIGVTHFLN